MTSRPPLLVATPLLGSGGGGIDGGGGADLLRKRCCSAGSCCSRRASDSWGHLRKAAAGVDDVALGWLSEGESAVFKAVLRARAVARQLAHRAVRACSAVARDQIKRCPSRVCQYYMVPAEV